MTSSDYSAEFYREHAQQYAHVAHEFLQSVYVKSSHPSLKTDWDAWERLKQLAPGKQGLDAGCGAGARDLFHLWSEGYDIVGVDAVEENIQVAQELHPEIADRVFVADLRRPLPFKDASFDFVACNAVIQHIEPGLVRDVVLPQLARVLRPRGVLQLMLKNGTGVITVFDKDYGVDRTFQLYDEHEMLGVLEGQAMVLIEADSPEDLGGFLYFTDPKQVDHCLFFSRKRERELV
jgi:SAM-dependent methyltransferase